MAGKKSGSLTDKVDKLGSIYQTIDSPEFIRSGSIVLDALLGGGIPRGCFILWSSQTGIGKSTGSLYVCKSYCVQGLKALYLDFEGGVNENQLRGIGLDKHKYHKTKNPNGKFFIYRVTTFVDAEAFLDDLLGEVDLIVFDSVTAMLPAKLQDKSVEDIQPGVQSRLMSNLLQKYKAASIDKGTSWIMINQMRTKISFNSPSKDAEAGGNALKFYADYRILMKKAYPNGTLGKEEETVKGTVKIPYGAINEVWCEKSRYTRPFVPLSLAVIFGKGISNIYSYKEFLESKGVVSKNGSWYSIDIGDKGEQYKCQGEQGILEWIGKNKKIVVDFIDSCGGYSLIMNEKENVESIDKPSSNEEQEYDYPVPTPNKEIPESGDEGQETEQVIIEE